MSEYAPTDQPNNPPTRPGPQQRYSGSDDEQHVKVLSILYYVFGGLSSLGACAGAMYVFFGIFLASGELPTSPGDPPPGLVGGVVIGVGIFMLVLSIVFCAALIYTGRCLQRRRFRSFCMVVAGFACLSIPLGTVLGVFTFVVLSRENVRQMFADAAQG